MKPTLPILLLTACCTAAVAAPLSKPKTAAEQKHATALHTILAKQDPNKAASKTTGALKRLIANSYWANGKIVDTNHYYYSGDRGSKFTDPNSYNDAFWVTDKQNIMSDSSLHWADNGSGFLQFAGRKMYTYDAGNKVTQMISMYPLYADVVVPTYNGSGKVSSLTVADTSGVTGVVSYIPKSKGLYTYNAQNLVTLDSTYILATGLPSAKTEYFYDANGNELGSNFSQYYTGGVWKVLQSDSNVYDGSNRLVVSVVKYDIGAGLANFLRDSFAYNGSSTMPYYHLHSQWDASTSSWDVEDLTYLHYNAQNMVDTYYSLQNNTLDTVEMDVYTYGPDGLLQRVNGYQYINHKFLTVPYDQTTEYFEEYFPVGVSTAVKDDAGIVIYPNPATDIVTIRSNNAASGNIRVYNAQGLQLSDMQHVSLGRQTINISTYPPGNYFINVTDENGAVQGHSVITKQ